MRATKRKCWLEKQSEDVRIYALSLFAQNLSFEECARKLKEKFRLIVSPRTLNYSWAEAVKPDLEARARALLKRQEFDRFIKEHPEADSAKLREVWFYEETLARQKGEGEKLTTKQVVTFSQRERELNLQERRVEEMVEASRLLEKRIAIDREKLELVREKVGGVREGVAKQKLSPGELQERLDEIYGIVEKK